jgi:DHA1 family bicyclomycin/chloramphenicol resistance-like MFS transporter
MLAGFAMFVIASIGAALTDSLPSLIVLRFLQAVGASVGTVVSRAVVRDTRDAIRTTVAIGHIAAVMGIAPIIAPVFGGWVGSTLGYRSVFFATATIGLLVLVLMYRTLPETLNRAQVRPGLLSMLENYRRLFRSRAFLGFSMLYGFTQGSFFAFMTVGAAVFESELNMTAGSFAITWSLMALAYVAGAVVSARMSQRIGLARLLEITVIVTCVTGCLTPVWTGVSGPTLASVVIPVTILMVSASAIIPGGIAGVVNAHPEMAGTASGLSNALALMFGGAFTLLAGLFYQGSYSNIAALIAVAVTLTGLSWLLVRSNMVKPAGH